MSRTAAALREHEAVIRTYVDTIRAVYEPVRHGAASPRSAIRARIRGSATPCSTCPSTPIYLLQVGDLPLGFYAPQSAVTMILTPGDQRSRCRDV